MSATADAIRLNARELTKGKLSSQESAQMRLLVREREDAKQAMAAMRKAMDDDILAYTTKQQAALDATSAPLKKVATMASLRISMIESACALRVLHEEKP